MATVTWMSLHDFVDHLLFWKDGTYEVWAPLPAWWLYHVYWPFQLALALVTGKKWSRANVSTSKMFKC
jgi:catechol O-methyltransferase